MGAFRVWEKVLETHDIDFMAKVVVDIELILILFIHTCYQISKSTLSRIVMKIWILYFYWYRNPIKIDHSLSIKYNSYHYVGHDSKLGDRYKMQAAMVRKLICITLQYCLFTHFKTNFSEVLKMNCHQSHAVNMHELAHNEWIKSLA